MASSGGNAAKRQAMTGQWRTPPLPTFAGQQQTGQAPSAMPPPSTNANVSSTSSRSAMPPIPANPLEGVPLPESTDDYAKALQEAYRLGAEAAAGMRQHQQQTQPSQAAVQRQQIHQQQQQIHHMPTPPQPTHAQLQQTQQVRHPHQDQHPHQQQQQLHQHQQQQQQKPPPPQQQQQQQQMHTAVSCPDLQQFQNAQNDPAAAPTLVPNPLAGALPPPISGAGPVQQPAATTGQVLPPAPTQQPPSTQPPVVVPTAASRSLSLPDMQSYAARAQAEEEKRKKRLARNRASARLRRLRKKNLVDSYEGEVGVLEASLQKLKSHSWGINESHEALLEALSMERGQQEISDVQRTQLIQQILKQQLSQVEFIREEQMEQQILKELIDNPDSEFSRELEQILQLTPEQKGEIAKSLQGLEQEVEAMETLVQCLEAMQSTNWLFNEEVAAITKQFTTILHPNQLSKFLLWTDTNAEALDTLDYCNAPPSQAHPANGPIFIFGMDDHQSHVASPAAQMSEIEH